MYHNMIMVLTVWYNLCLFISQNIPTAPRLEPLVSSLIELELILFGKVCKLIVVTIWFMSQNSSYTLSSTTVSKRNLMHVFACDSTFIALVNIDKRVLVEENENCVIFFLSESQTLPDIKKSREVFLAHLQQESQNLQHHLLHLSLIEKRPVEEMLWSPLKGHHLLCQSYQMTWKPNKKKLILLHKSMLKVYRGMHHQSRLHSVMVLVQWWARQMLYLKV